EMKDAKNTPTRPLDFFESAGMEALRKGENLFVRSKDNTIRMLGGVRADTECLSCHGGKKKGDLLGAFSYTLRIAEYRMELRLKKWPAGRVGNQFGMFGGGPPPTPPAPVRANGAGGVP